EPAERMQDILMHDFNWVDAYTKQLALEWVVQHDPEAPVVKAFTQSHLPELRQVTHQIPDAEESPAVQVLKQHITRLGKWLGLDRSERAWIFRWSATIDSKVHKLREAARSGALLPVNHAFLLEEKIANDQVLQLDLMALVVLKQLKTS
ncbi:MAG TPA: hypothetical protein VG842_11640, partial [Sediminibacterium sp.]|nr:hypothetical protein [Sediminibacterium sp.]